MQSEDNLVWLDLEMTGLDPDKCTIIEIATVITDSELHVLAEGPSVAIRQDAEKLRTMEKWSRDTHTKSGLLRRVEASKISTREAEEQTLEFIKHFCPERVSPLCGNSIGHDRRFLERYMPNLFAYFHYRNIDVSTLKELIRRWFPHGPSPPMKKGSHLALEDIRESINEMIFYRDNYFIKR
jgi:oligoribonuclease